MDIGKLFVCGNQIGNLFDLPASTVATLQRCNNIVCDTKDRFMNEIVNPLSIDISDKNIFAFEPELANTDSIMEFVVKHIDAGEDVAFICDAGMPGISDWGTQLVAEMHDNNIPVEIVPGPSILTTALAVAGIPAKTEKVFYAGFMEQTKQDVLKTIEATKSLRSCLVLIDHPEEMGELINIVDYIYDNPFLALCINLTMPSQQIMRGNAKEIFDKYKELDNLDCFMTLVVDGS